MIKVLFFASLREQFGQRELSMDLAQPKSVRDLADELESHHNLSLAGALVAVNEAYAAAKDTVKPGDTVAFFPPVSGG